MSLPTLPSANGLTVGFAGTPQFAASILQALVSAGHRPAVVYSQPDRPVGRGRKVRASPVKDLALALGLPVRQPASLRSPDEAAALREFHLDVLVVTAYGLILPAAILEVPRFGCINVHASLLPRWRGAAPIERAILAGDTETGACIMAMDPGLDTGPVYLCRRCPIEPDTDAPALEMRLAQLGGAALIECLERLPELAPVPQPASGVTYAHKLTRADAVLRWSEPAVTLDRQVRALAGRQPATAHAGAVRVSVLEAHALPGAFAGAPPGTILDADRSGIRVACAEGQLQLTRVRLNVGKGRPLAASDALNGYPALFEIGAILRDGDAPGAAGGTEERRDP